MQHVGPTEDWEQLAHATVSDGELIHQTAGGAHDLVFGPLRESRKRRAREGLPGEHFQPAERGDLERRAATDPHRGRHGGANRKRQATRRPPPPGLAKQHEAPQRVANPSGHAVAVEPAADGFAAYRWLQHLVRRPGKRHRRLDPARERQAGLLAHGDPDRRGERDRHLKHEAAAVVGHAAEHVEPARRRSLRRRPRTIVGGGGVHGQVASRAACVL